jgi:hypothetical protein
VVLCFRLESHINVYYSGTIQSGFIACTTTLEERVFVLPVHGRVEFQGSVVWTATAFGQSRTDMDWQLTLRFMQPVLSAGRWWMMTWTPVIVGVEVAVWHLSGW